MKHLLISKSTLKPAVWDGGETFEYFIFPENSVYPKGIFCLESVRLPSIKSHQILPASMLTKDFL